MPSIGVPEKNQVSSSPIPCNQSFIVSRTGDTSFTKSPFKEIESQNPEVAFVKGWGLFSLMFSLITVVFCVLLDMIIVVTAIPRITSTFHSLADIGWYGAAYNLASSALQPLAGKFYTYFNAKRIFLTYLAVFELGSLICALASSSGMFISGRVVAGIGSSGLQSGALSIISDAAPLEKQPFLIGMTMALVQLATASGPLIGGALTYEVSWRWCFYINLPIGAVGAIMILAVHLPRRQQVIRPKSLKAATVEFDLCGVLLFIPAVVMLLLALEWGGSQFPWKSATTIGLLVGACVTTAIFVLWEIQQGRVAMIPIHILRKTQIYSACVMMLTLLSTVFLASYYLPVYFQSVKGVNPLEAGTDMLPAILTQIVCAMICGLLSQKVGYYLPFAVLGSTILCIGNGLLTTLNTHTSVAEWAGYQIIVGIGRGLGMQMPIIAIQAYTPREFIPSAMAFLTFCQTFGGAVFLAIANAIFNNKLQDKLEERAPDVNIRKVFEAGATGIRHAVSSENLEAVLESYSYGVDSVFYLATALAMVCFVFSCLIGWKDTRRKEIS